MEQPVSASAEPMAPSDPDVVRSLHGKLPSGRTFVTCEQVLWEAQNQNYDEIIIIGVNYRDKEREDLVIQLLTLDVVRSDRIVWLLEVSKHNEIADSWRG